jgi:hypothetical protein
MINFIIKNWISLLAAIAALGSFIVSFQVKLQSQAAIEADVDQNLHWIIMLLSEDGRSVVNKYGLAFFDVRIINPSSIDVGYFDLRVFDEKNHEEFNFFKTEQINKLNNTQKMVIHTAIGQNESYYINLPSGITGVFKAHSVTTLSFVITPNKNTKTVSAIFKLARKKPLFRKTKNGYICSKYESILVSSSLDKSSKPDYQKLQEQVDGEEPNAKN